jgi:hypothetical protein
MATVIDSLIVTLGLDPKQFTKGQKEAAKAVVDTQTTVEKAAQGMSKAIKEVALEFVGLFLVVRSLQDVVSFFENMNAATRQLGIDSKNIGTSAAELRDWQNAASMAGGSAEGITKTMLGLQQSLFNMKFKGEMSDQLIYLARLGVQFETASGQVKPFKDIMLATAGAMERSTLSRPDKASFLQAAGFDTGSINLILSGTKALQGYYDQQLKLRQVSDADVEAATRMAQAWELLKENVTAGAQKLLTSAEPAITALFKALEEGIDWLNKPENSQPIIDWLNNAAKWVAGPGAGQIKGYFADLASIVHGLAVALAALPDLGHLIGGSLADERDWENNSPTMRTAQKVLGLRDWSDDTSGTFSTGKAPTRAQRNHNPGNLKATGSQARDKDGFAVFGSDAEGIEAMRHQLSLYASRGNNTIGGIVKTYEGADAPGNHNDVPAYIADVSKRTGIDANAQLTAAQLASVAQAMATHEGARVPASAFAPIPGALNAARGANPTPALGSQVPGPGGYPTASNNTSSVDINSITINSQATDARGIARDLHREVQRRFQVTQSDGGQLA